jgi:hypothetical protein
MKYDQQEKLNKKKKKYICLALKHKLGLKVAALTEAQ